MQDYFPRQQAAQYQLDNMTGKSLLTGDMSRAFAIESLGGQEQLIKDANRKANYEADAMMAGGLGVIGTSLVASGAAATTGVGAILAPFIAGGGALAGLRKFLPTVSLTCDFVAPAKVGDWVEGRPELVRQTRSLLFTNIYLTVGEEKILRASAIAKIPSGDGPAFSRARLDRSAEMASKSPST